MSANRLPETRSALESLSSSQQIMFGLHEEPAIRVNALGRDVTEVPYDRAIHDPSAINHLSIWEDITGEPQVRQVKPYRPLCVSFLVDKTLRDPEDPVVTASKAMVADSLRSIFRADGLPRTDRMTDHLVSDRPVEAGNPKLKIISVENRNEVPGSISQIARRGLTIAISDFSRMDFAPGSLDNVLAVKLNHPSERRVDAGKRLVGLGKFLEVNSASERQIDTMNGQLDEVHDGIVSRLQTAGAEVVSLLTDGSEAGFKEVTADQELAQAINNLQGKQK